MKRYFPNTDQGSVLITSRLTELKQLGVNHKLQVMNNNQSKILIEHKAGRILKGITREPYNTFSFG